MALDTFALQIENFSNKSLHTMTLITKKTAIDLFSSVVRDTPVDEGYLRGGWQTSFNSPITADNNISDPNGVTALKGIAQGAEQLRSDGTIYFSNLKPYAEVVEDGLYPTKNADNPNSKVTTEGYSKKSPAGMVKKNLPRFDTIVQQNANEAGLN